MEKEVNQIFTQLPIEEGPFTLDEIKAAVASMPCGKALGVDEVPMELLKIGRVQELLIPFLNDMDTSNEESPAEMLLGSFQSSRTKAAHRM